MTLNVGTRLGHYDVTALIGEGGMGQVYQATDTKLNRQVALKILPEAFGRDPDRLVRFQREAQVLASLNHPGIAAIYGIEEREPSAGSGQVTTRALVLELVEGPTLADRISQGPIPIAEAVPIARQIAEAIEAAHEAGVIHRDLKPANIKVREDGTVKVVDFGLAKVLDTAYEGDPSQSPTMTAAATQTGVIMGTAAYMAPEQARGKTVDKRADIWAFGVVLYEMLTGTRAFESQDVSLTLADVMRSEPAWERLPEDVSPALRTYLERCLAKEPRQRVQAIGDVRLALEGRFDSAGETVPPPTSGRAGWPAALPFGLLMLGIGGAVAGLAVWTLIRPGTTEPAPVARFLVTTPADAPVEVGAEEPAVAISPDGRRVAYEAQAGAGIYLREIGQLEPTFLRGTEGGNYPVFSPDGEDVLFRVSNQPELRRVSVLGGPAVTICACADPPIADLSWGRDDVIVFATEAGSGLMRVPAAGGEAAVLTTVEEGGAAHYWPEVLPDSGGVLFTEWSGGDSASRIAVVSLETGEIRSLVAGSYPQYSPTGHIVYGVEGTLRAVPFDLERLDVTGDSVLILESVTSKRTGAFNFDVSADGSLVYVLGDDGGSERRLVWFDRDGQVEPLPLPPNPYRNAQLSPDGTRLVALIENPDNNDLWVSEVDRNTLTKLTTHPGNDIRGLWTTDGERIVFLSDREIPGGSLLARAADGTSDIESVGSNEDFPGPNPLGWSPDGRRLVFQYGSAENRDIGVLSLNGEPKWDVLIATESRELNPTLSPDGRWIAYQSNQTGGAEVYVDRFPDLGQRQRVSSARGFLPQWSPDGRELFYVGGDRRRLMRVPVETGATFNFGTVDQLFQSAGFVGLQDIAPDGRFLSILPVNTPAERGQQQVVWVQNWFEELTNRVPIP